MPLIFASSVLYARFFYSAALGTVTRGEFVHAQRWSSRRICRRDFALITLLLGLETSPLAPISIFLRLVGLPTAVSGVIETKKGPDSCPRTMQRETNPSACFAPSSVGDIVTVNNGQERLA
jgi:hypothetical protein